MPTWANRHAWRRATREAPSVASLLRRFIGACSGPGWFIPLLLSAALSCVLTAGLAWGAQEAGPLLRRGATHIAQFAEAPLPLRAPVPGATRSLPEPAPAGSRPEKAAIKAPRTLPRKVAAPPSAAAERSAGSERSPSFPTLRTSLAAPPCEDVYVYIVTVFENRGQSVATLSFDPKQSGRQRRIGQRFGEYEVVDIRYNPRRMSSAVWLAKGQEVCQAMLRDEHPVRERLQRSAARREELERAKQRKRSKKRKKRKKNRRRKR